MADETATEVKKSEPKPLMPFATKPISPDESGAAARLRAFEDEKLGKDIHRINGRIERGSGSFFQTKLTDADRRHHAALERLVEAEQKVAEAKVAMANAVAEAEAAYAAAEADVEKAPPDPNAGAEKTGRYDFLIGGVGSEPLKADADK